MSTEDNLIEHLDQVNKVLEEYLKGSEPTQIYMQLDLASQMVV